PDHCTFSSPPNSGAQVDSFPTMASSTEDSFDRHLIRATDQLHLMPLIDFEDEPHDKVSFVVVNNLLMGFWTSLTLFPGHYRIFSNTDNMTSLANPRRLPPSPLL